MVRVVTDLGDLRESARRTRFEQTAGISDTNVQDAIKTLDSRTDFAAIRKPPSSATVAILASDIFVGLDTRTTAVTATLPSAAAWAAANPSAPVLYLIDIHNNAATNNITPSLFAGDSFEYGSVVPVVNENLGKLALGADPSLPGWYVLGVN